MNFPKQWGGISDSNPFLIENYRSRSCFFTFLKIVCCNVLLDTLLSFSIWYLI
jgi:hypothetical protein